MFGEEVFCPSAVWHFVMQYNGKVGFAALGREWPLPCRTSNIGSGPFCLYKHNGLLTSPSVDFG